MGKKEKKNKKEEKQKKIHYERVQANVSSTVTIADILTEYVINMATAQKDAYEMFDNYVEFNLSLSSNAQYQKHILNMQTRQVSLVRAAVDCPLFNMFYVDTEDGSSIFPDELLAGWCFIDGKPCGKRKVRGVTK